MIGRLFAFLLCTENIDVVVGSMHDDWIDGDNVIGKAVNKKEEKMG